MVTAVQVGEIDSTFLEETSLSVAQWGKGLSVHPRHSHFDLRLVGKTLERQTLRE